MTLSTYAANAMLDHTFGGAACPQPTAWWVQLHYGDPGVNGTANVFVSAWREAVTLWETVANGQIRNDVKVEWRNVPDPLLYGTNYITHVSIWNALWNGKVLTHGPLTTARYLAVGDVFTLAVHEIVEAVT